MGVMHETAGGPPHVLGLSFGYHDSACVLMQGGRLVAAVQEERFSRVKNDPAFPRRSVRYCLAEGRISLADVDVIGYYEDPREKKKRQLLTALSLPEGEDRSRFLDRMLSKPDPIAQIRDLLGYTGPVQISDHHLSHAASAFFFSGFEEAAILTVDAVGDRPTTTYGMGCGAELRRFEAVDYPDSLGLFYSALTDYLGFEVNEGEYKVMGLAPFGRTTFVPQLESLVRVDRDGQFRLNMDYFDFTNERVMYSEALIHALGRAPRKSDEALEQFHMDVARSTQVVLETVLLSKLGYLHERAQSENLCMAGGVALNVVANRRCLQEGPFKRLFVQPAAGDAGGALGAASMAHIRLTGERPCSARMDSVFLGPATNAQRARAVLDKAGVRYTDFSAREPELLERAADYLASGRVIGWCQGRMEFGPRALGARSILADPRDPGMKDRVNSLVKMREGFRPFAPAVLESCASEYFELDHGSPFMTEVAQVISKIPLPSITHVDGSARVQTVAAHPHPRFHALLEHFYRRTGCPVLLNTSYNVKGEPIVASELEALVCFIRCSMDALVLEDFIIDRADVPHRLRTEIQSLARYIQQRSGLVSNSVYTFV